MGSIPTPGLMKIEGIALKEGSQTLGTSGIEKIWPPKTLAKAAPSLEGTPVWDKAGMGSGTASVVGEVTRSQYMPNAGVLFEAEIFDEQVAMKLQQGLVELAPRLTHESVSQKKSPMVIEDAEFEGLFAAEETVGGAQSIKADGKLQP